MTDPKKTQTPSCPFCGYALTLDGMQSAKTDLFALAVQEDHTVIQCPSCDLQYACQGGYTPHYTSAAHEYEL